MPNIIKTCMTKVYNDVQSNIITRVKNLPQMSINWDKKWQMHCMQTDYNSAFKRALCSESHWNMDPPEKYWTWKKHIKITSRMILCLWNVYMEFIEKVDENDNLFLFLSYLSTLLSRVHPVLGIQWIFNVNLLADCSSEAIYKTMGNPKA